MGNTTQEENKPQLSQALQGKFEMVGYVPGEFQFKGLKFDTTKCSEKDVEAAIAAGFKGIRKIEKKGANETPSDSKKEKLN